MTHPAPRNIIGNPTNDGFHVFDVETTMNSDLPNKASPFDKRNWLVAIGQEIPMQIPHTLVGHNITFDLNWIRRCGQLPVDTLKKRSIWDTQLAAYLLSGQQTTMSSLDALSTKYGGTLKDNAVSDYFARGLGAEHVPKHMLDSYLQHDITNTRLVLEKQMQEVCDNNMVPLVLSQMEALLATSEMQHNGMCIDRTFMEAQLRALDGANAHMHKMIKEASKKYSPPEHVFDFTSNKQLSTLLYGGTLKWENRVANGVYKTGAKMGQPKFKIERGESLFPVLVPNDGTESVDDSTLTGLLPTLNRDLHELVDFILVQRKLNKQLTTYFEGHLACATDEGYVHPQHNHTITRTGRLSSSGPNMQNVTSDGAIKRAYVSRWGDDGRLVEFDYQQLEIVVLAHLSDDLVLKNDLITGKDMHSELYKSMYGRYPTKEERKPFKRLSFALVYGGGVNAMMENAGVDKETASKFRKVFYERYQGVSKWHKKLKDQAVSNVTYDGRKTKKGFPSHTYRYQSETGRWYEFHEYDNDWTGVPSFSPTELVNYPVQGTATGDIVPMVLGKLFRVLINSSIYDKCKMINTVHDSVLFDIHVDVLDDAIKMIKSTMEAAPAYYKETFGKEFSLPLPVGVSVGLNWLDMKEQV